MITIDGVRRRKVNEVSYLSPWWPPIAIIQPKLSLDVSPIWQKATDQVFAIHAIAIKRALNKVLGASQTGDGHLGCCNNIVQTITADVSQDWQTDLTKNSIWRPLIRPSSTTRIISINRLLAIDFSSTYALSRRWYSSERRRFLAPRGQSAPVQLPSPILRCLLRSFSIPLRFPITHFWWNPGKWLRNQEFQNGSNESFIPSTTSRSCNRSTAGSSLPQFTDIFLWRSSDRNTAKPAVLHSLVWPMGYLL